MRQPDWKSWATEPAGCSEGIWVTAWCRAGSKAIAGGGVDGGDAVAGEDVDQFLLGELDAFERGLHGFGHEATAAFGRTESTARARLSETLSRSRANFSTA
jgi:hypothetical protein